MNRRPWGELPEPVRQAIIHHCGEVLDTRSAPAGRHSEFSATLRISGGASTPTGEVFVKGVTADHPQASGHRHEERVNSWLPALAPRLLWVVETAGWIMLGFEHVNGRHADLSPGSADVELLTDAVCTLTERLAPCPAGAVPVLAEQWARFAAWRRLRHSPPADLHPWSRTNLDNFVEWERHAIAAINGNSLAHTDLHSLNVIVDGSAHIVDWAWSRQAAPWVDIGFLIPRLIQAGHTPAQAERWAMAAPTWRETSDHTRTAFAIGLLGLWEFLERDKPLPHRPQLTHAARRWVRYRLG